MPRVAIIMRTKDRSLLLKRAIAGVRAQTETDWQLVIVNDGGDPAAVEAVIEGFGAAERHPPIVIHNPTSIRLEPAANKGIAASDSEYIVIHDDDDTWHPTFLEMTLQHPHMERVAGVVTGFERVWERIEGDKVTEESREDLRHWTKNLTLWEMCGDNLFPPIAFLYKRAAYEKAGPYPDLPVAGDWVFNIQLMRHFDIAYEPQILALWHHRITAMEGYENTTGHGTEELWRETNRRIRNDFLRKDLDNGEVGLGFLMNIATATRDIQNTDNSIREMVLDMHQLKHRVSSRLRRLHLLPKETGAKD